MNPAAAVVIHRIQIEPGLLYVDWNIRLQRGRRRWPARRQRTAIDICPRPRAATSQCGRGIGERTGLQIHFHLSHFVGDDEVKQLHQPLTLAVMAWGAGIVKLDLETVTRYGWLSRALIRRGLHMAGDALLFQL